MNQDPASLVAQAIERSKALLWEKNSEDAEALLKQVLKVDPVNLEATQILGGVYLATRRNDEAIQTFQRLIDDDPQNAENYNNLGLAYGATTQREKAVACFRKATELRFNPAFYNNLAVELSKGGSIDESISFVTKAIRRNRRHALSWLNAAVFFGLVKNMRKAIRCFKVAVKLDPKSQQAKLDLSHAYHMIGDEENAWPLYESRIDVLPQFEYVNRRYPPAKRWKGESLSGKKLVVYCEQGMGDFIQFARYLPLLKPQCELVVDTSEPLATLFDKQDFGRVVSRAEPCDVHCSVMSLPFYLGGHGMPCPYITVPDRFDLSQYSGLKVGISWAGNPQHPLDRLRSCWLKEFDVLEMPGITFFSMQKDVRPRAYHDDPRPVDLTEGARIRMVDMAPVMNDFMDTARIISSLDLVVSVDTSILHLAGAMGKPAWALIPFNPDWRWGVEGSRTKWYPSVTLFRQTRLNDWASVFKEVCLRLQDALLHGLEQSHLPQSS